MTISDEPMSVQRDNGGSLSSSALSMEENGHNGDASHPTLSVVIPPDRADAIDASPQDLPPFSKVGETVEMFPVLRNYNFLTLWGSQVLSQVADKIYLVFMIALIAEHYQGNGQSVSGWVSSVMIAFTIPAVVFGSIAGVMVDWWSKKSVLVLTNILRGGLVFLLPLGFKATANLPDWWGVPVGFWLILGTTLMISTLTQFFAPAEQAAIPLIVKKENLLSANSFYTLTMMAAVIVGFAAGDPLLSLTGDWAIKLGGSADLGRECLVGGGYALAGIILLVVSIKETVIERSQTLNSVWFDIKVGFQYLREQAEIRSAVIQLTMLFSIMAALAVLVVRLAEILPEIKTSQFGFLLGAGGLGMTIGLVFLTTIGDRYARKVLGLIGSLILACSLLGMVFSIHSLSISLVLLLGIGVGAALVGVPMQTVIQEKTPEEMRGKVFGLQNNLVNIALSLPLALAGIAETWLGIRVVFLGLTSLAVTSGLINWYISRTQISSSCRSSG
jgi:MFS family permease